MISALASISGLSTLALVGVVVWLVYRALGAKDAELAIGKALDKEREDHRATRGELQVEEAAHTVTRDLLERERMLRAGAEVQRNEALRRARELLAKHMGDATNEEIATATAELFAGFDASTPSAVVRGASGGVPPRMPDAHQARTDDTGLERP